MRLPLTTQNKTPNFIGSWLIEPLSVCDEIIEYFESNKAKQKRGRITEGEDLDAKNSIDLSISPKDLLAPSNSCFQTYFKGLFDCYADYTAQWPFVGEMVDKLEIGKFNIQRYQKNQHFLKVHAERAGISTLHRLFAWMTYLNDVPPEDGGSTIFTHYDLAVQPTKGQTLIWPAEWTHAHKGSKLNRNSKYIITGWMHFPKHQTETLTD